MRIVRVVFVLLVMASALEIADDQGLVGQDSATASAADTLRSLRTGDLGVGPLDELGDLAAEVRRIVDPFRLAAEGLD